MDSDPQVLDLLGRIADSLDRTSQRLDAIEARVFEPATASPAPPEPVRAAAPSEPAASELPVFGAKPVVMLTHPKCSRKVYLVEDADGRILKNADGHEVSIVFDRGVPTIVDDAMAQRCARESLHCLPGNQYGEPNFQPVFRIWESLDAYNADLARERERLGDTRIAEAEARAKEILAEAYRPVPAAPSPRARLVDAKPAQELAPAKPAPRRVHIADGRA